MEKHRAETVSFQRSVDNLASEEICTAFLNLISLSKPPINHQIVHQQKPEFKKLMDVLQMDFDMLHLMDKLMDQEPTNMLLKDINFVLSLLCHCVQTVSYSHARQPISLDYHGPGTNFPLGDTDNGFRKEEDILKFSHYVDLLKDRKGEVKAKRNNQYSSQLNMINPSDRKVLFELCPPGMDRTDCNKMMSMFVTIISRDIQRSDKPDQSKKSGTSGKSKCSGSSPRKLSCYFNNVSDEALLGEQNKEFQSSFDGLTSVKRSGELCFDAVDKFDCFDHYIQAVVTHKVSNSRNLKKFIGRKAR